MYYRSIRVTHDLLLFGAGAVSVFGASDVWCCWLACAEYDFADSGVCKQRRRSSSRHIRGPADAAARDAVLAGSIDCMPRLGLHCTPLGWLSRAVLMAESYNKTPWFLERSAIFLSSPYPLFYRTGSLHLTNLSVVLCALVSTSCTCFKDLFPGLAHSFLGLAHSFLGLAHSCPGLAHSCPGLAHSCPGLEVLQSMLSCRSICI